MVVNRNEKNHLVELIQPEIPPPEDHPPQEDQNINDDEIDEEEQSESDSEEEEQNESDSEEEEQREGGNQDDKFLCRVCHAEINMEEELDELLSPCRCIGSMAFIHRECFNRMQRNRCEICRFRYVAGEPPTPPRHAPNLEGMPEFMRFEFDINFERPDEANDQAARLFQEVTRGILPEDREDVFPVRQLGLMLFTHYFKFFTNQISAWRFNWLMFSAYLWTIRQAARVQSFRMFKRFFLIYFFTTIMTVVTYTTVPIMYALYWLKKSWKNLLLYSIIFGGVRVLFRLYDQPDLTDWLVDLVENNKT